MLRSPREVAPHLSKVSGAAVAFMKYDPNYCDDDDDEDEDGSDEVRQNKNFGLLANFALHHVVSSFLPSYF